MNKEMKGVFLEVVVFSSLWVNELRKGAGSSQCLVLVVHHFVVVVSFLSAIQDGMAMRDRAKKEEPSLESWDDSRASKTLLLLSYVSFLKILSLSLPTHPDRKVNDGFFLSLCFMILLFLHPSSSPSASLSPICVMHRKHTQHEKHFM